MVYFLVKIRPFKTRINNFLEILNETTFLALFYTTYLFTDFILEPKAKDMVGWVFIGLIALNCIINLSLIIF